MTRPPGIPVLKLNLHPRPPHPRLAIKSRCLLSLIITVSAITARFIRPTFSMQSLWDGGVLSVLLLPVSWLVFIF